MPTGYTAGVSDGTVTTFQAFAMNCARAFGALIEMRDSPSDAPIPDAFAPTPYHDERLAAAQQELAELDAVSDEEAERRASSEFATAMTSWEQNKRDREEKRHRYQSMLDQVSAWHEPTPEHKGLKDFMVQQLSESIRFDCDHDDERWIPKRQTVAQWREMRREHATRDIAYHMEKGNDDRGRAQERTEWVKDLRRSLSEATTDAAVR